MASVPRAEAMTTDRSGMGNSIRPWHRVGAGRPRTARGGADRATDLAPEQWRYILPEARRRVHTLAHGIIRSSPPWCPLRRRVPRFALRSPRGSRSPHSTPSARRPAHARPAAVCPHDRHPLGLRLPELLWHREPRYNSRFRCGSAADVQHARPPGLVDILIAPIRRCLQPRHALPPQRRLAGSRVSRQWPGGAPAQKVDP